MTKKDKINAVKNLSWTEWTSDHTAEFVNEINAIKNDRGFCLMMTALVENSLQVALESKLNCSKEMMKRLTDLEGPLGTLSRKITMAYALKILGAKTHANFDIIRHLRNAFAHTRIPINFSTAEIVQLCDELDLLDPGIPSNANIGVPPTARGRFQDACSTLSYLLAFYSGMSAKVENGPTISKKGEQLP